MLSVCLAPGAMAASSSGSTIYLYDTGNAAPDATCDWYAKVQTPAYVYTGANLTIDAAMVMYNGTGLAADAVYTVSVTISDGTASVTSEVDITTAVAKTGEIVFTDVALGALADTTNGTMTISLLTAADATGSVNWFAGVMISMLAVVLVLGALGGLFGKISGLIKR